MYLSAMHIRADMSHHFAFTSGTCSLHCKTLRQTYMVGSLFQDRKGFLLPFRSKFRAEPPGNPAWSRAVLFCANAHSSVDNKVAKPKSLASSNIHLLSGVPRSPTIITGMLPAVPCPAKRCCLKSYTRPRPEDSIARSTCCVCGMLL